MLLIEKNLEVVLTQAKPFVISFLPQLAPLTLVSGEHFMLKDLPFYKATRLVDVEARQARLDASKKQRQKGTLFQAPGSAS